MDPKFEDFIVKKKKEVAHSEGGGGGEGGGAGVGVAFWVLSFSES